MPAKVATILDNLQTYQLLEPAKINELRRLPQAKGDDPTPLCRELVQRSLLTNFQANQLLRGNGKELVIGPYRLLDKLGEGGMGQVFKAFHANMQRIVALKIIRKEKLAHPDAVKRFYQEVQNTGKLQHPNIVMAFDAGQDNGTHYMAMEYVEGTDLSKLVKQNGPLPVMEACDFIRQAAQALQCAHENGLVHRDIKPANMLMSRPGGSDRAAGASGTNLVPRAVIKVLDLGLARIQGDDTSQLTRVGTVIGTPEYLAPEQAKSARTVDIRADLYSLGCTFYFLLAGQAPFKGTTVMEILVKHMEDQPKSIDQHRNDVPPQLWLVIKKLLAKKPEDRYQTPADLVQALAPFTRRGGPDVLTPSTAIKPAAAVAAGARKTSATLTTAAVRKKIKKRGWRKRRLVAAAGLLLVLCLAAIGYFGLKGGAGDTGKSAEVARTPSPATFVSVKSWPKPDTAIPPKLDPLPKFDPPGPDIKGPDFDVRKRPIPPPDRQAEAEATIKERYRSEYARTAPNERAILAGKLLEEGKNYRPMAKGMSHVRYVLLREARDVATDAGDLNTALRAIDELERHFNVPALLLKVEALEKVIRLGAGQGDYVLRGAVDHGLRLADFAIDNDNYGMSHRALDAASAAANQVNDPLLNTQVRTRRGEAFEIVKEFHRVRDSRDRLQTAPEDASANLQWGRFLCLYKGNWPIGLSHLTLGNDAAIRAMAERDLGSPRDPLQQVQIGNEWWRAGENERGLPRKNLLLHARHWYEQALPQLNGATRTEVERRINQLNAEGIAPPRRPAGK